MTAATGSPKGAELGRRLAVFVAGIRQWAMAEKARREASAEIESLNRAGLLDEVLRDLGLSRSVIDDLVNADPQTPHRLEAMLAHFGLSSTVDESHPLWALDMERVCRQCRETGKCDLWLAGDRKGGIDEFCLNAQTLNSLAAALRNS